MLLIWKLINTPQTSHNNDISVMFYLSRKSFILQEKCFGGFNQERATEEMLKGRTS